MEQELRILNRVQHHNVISLCDLFRDDEKQKLYIIMDYCTGSLQQMLDGSEEKKLPLFQAHSFFTQLIDGLNYLHAHGKSFKKHLIRLFKKLELWCAIFLLSCH